MGPWETQVRWVIKKETLPDLCPLSAPLSSGKPWWAWGQGSLPWKEGVFYLPLFRIAST